MKTEKVYYEYNAAEPFGASILELRPAGDGNTCVYLDRTIFYPEGGGQAADRGTINGIPVLDVREKDGEILHMVSDGTLNPNEAGKLKPGPAELVLDSRRRRDFTVLHTGQHLLSGIILRMTGKPTVSVHLGEETCTIDVDAAEVNDETLVALEEDAADAIEENHPVIIHNCPPEDVSSFPLRKAPPRGEELIRVVEIQGHDFSACCGTHLKSTGEIGILRILGAEKYKGMTRISFIAGRRVLSDSRVLRQNAAVVSRALKVPLSETGRGVLDFLEKTAQTEKRLRILQEESARVKTEALLRKACIAAAGAGGTGYPGPALVVESYAEAGIDEVLCIGRAAQKETGALLVLVSERDLKFAAFCSTRGFDLRPLIKEACVAQGGRGGGSPSFFQGSFETKEAMGAFLEALRKYPA